MAEIKQGSVSVLLAEHIPLHPKAGQLSPSEIQQLIRARRGIGLAAELTAGAMTKNPDRLAVPGLAPTKLAAQGKAAEEIDVAIGELESVLVILKQNNLLLDAEAHDSLRRVINFVRAQAKFDPRIVDLVPHLTAYFSNAKNTEPTIEPGPETP